MVDLEFRMTYVENNHFWAILPSSLWWIPKKLSVGFCSATLDVQAIRNRLDDEMSVLRRLDGLEALGEDLP